MPQKKKLQRKTTAVAPEVRFGAVVERLSALPGVVRKKEKGFGSGALTVKGRIFAMLSSTGDFVIKVSRSSADKLVEDGVGEYYSPGHGRIMKQWVAVAPGAGDWLELAEAAYRYARDNND